MNKSFEKIKEFKLTDTEKLIFSKITEYAKSLTQKVVPRVAGGWVRDKIMDNDCYDIDITLDTVSGYDFALGLKNFYVSDSLKTSDIGVIKMNPEKSKHLETAAMRMNGVFVDFLNLRSETYSNSRIPNITNGSPKEDAFRRDLTINSLFYNLITEEIEDFTEMGINDILNKTIRTPLPPLQTFLDDPLRILRIFRFAAKFNFKIEDEIFEAIQNEKVKVCLREKVSKERIGKEIEKIINNPNAELAMFSFIKLNLINEIFEPEYKVKINIEDAMELNLNICSKKEYKCHTCIHKIDMSIFYLYLILIFFKGIKVQKEKFEFLNVFILREKLKFPNVILKRIKNIEENFIVLDAFEGNESLCLEDFIKLNRKMKDEWYISLIIYSTVCLINKNVIKQEFVDKILVETCKNFLCKSFEIKSKVDGNFIKEIVKDDPRKIAILLEEGVIYQILNPKASINDIKRYLEELGRKN